MKLSKPWSKPPTAIDTETPASTATGRVTDETIEQHRKEIFSRGRRFLYPIHTTKRHIVRKSLIVSSILVVVFLSTVGVLIYRYKAENTFIYQISKVVPFPIARVNSNFVSYEEYLFLLRSNLTYLEDNEQSGDLLDEISRASLREEALQEAKQNAVLKQLAERYDISVSDDEVEEQIELLRSFSGGDRRLNDIVREFYGYSLGDLRYPLYLQLLKQKLAPRLSTEAQQRADAALARVNQGEDFTTVAREISEDEVTAGNGGSLGLVDRSSTELPAEVIRAGFELSIDATSGLVESQIGFHIVKKLSQSSETSAELAHILIRYDDINDLLARELENARVSTYIKLSRAQE